MMSASALRLVAIRLGGRTTVPAGVVLFCCTVALGTVQAENIPWREQAPRVALATPRAVADVWERTIVLAQQHGAVLARDEPSHFLLIKARLPELGIDYYTNVVLQADREAGVTRVTCLSSLSQDRFIEGCEHFIAALEAALK